MGLIRLFPFLLISLSFILICGCAGAQIDDLSKCESYSDIESRDLCVFTLAANLDDPTLCDTITTRKHSISCYLTLADHLSDPSLCEKISDETAREVCLEEIEIDIDSDIPNNDG